ncbi:hypothetical protein GC163_07655 [bacterium]|nr:hypothetical protein [bacterium]
MATGWFQRATAAFSRSEPIPQKYDVNCDCGARLTGIRVPIAQKPSCPECGIIVFILPATVYPVPASVERRWLGNDLPETVATFPKSKKYRSVREQRRDKERARKAKAEREVVQPPSEPGIPFSQRFRQLFTPIRLVILTMAVGLLLTGWVMIRNVRRDRAQRELQGSLDRGHAALANDDYPKAAQEFQQATAALDILGRQDDIARQVRRTSRESMVTAGLSSRSFSETLERWILKAPKDSATSLGDKAGWFLFEAELHPSTASEYAGEPTPLVIDLPLQIGKTPVVVLMEPPPWKNWLTSEAGEQSQRVLFAAQLRRGEVPQGDRAVARVWLNESTAILWSNTETLPESALPADDDEASPWSDLVVRQREFLESQP